MCIRDSYGTAWATKEEQEAYLHMLEEAERRDHRKIGRELDLFHFQDEAPGLIFWHPKGWALWQQVEQYMRSVYRDNGYQEVKAPQILDISLWKKTGHWAVSYTHLDVYKRQGARRSCCSSCRPRWNGRARPGARLSGRAGRCWYSSSSS